MPVADDHVAGEVHDGHQDAKARHSGEQRHRDAGAPQDLAEGRIQTVITHLTNVLSQMQAGRVRLLAVTNKERAPLAPAIPTAKEAGYPDLPHDCWTVTYDNPEVWKWLLAQKLP